MTINPPLYGPGFNNGAHLDLVTVGTEISPLFDKASTEYFKGFLEKAKRERRKGKLKDGVY
jgi:hypothetical protein